MPADGPLVSERVERPLTCRLRVRHRLERREGLRRDDEQGVGRIEIARGLGEVGAVHVRHEAEGQVARAVVLQRLVGHDRTEIGAADPDIDDRAHAPAGVPAPPPVPDLVGERGHPIEHLVHVRHDVLAVEDDRRAARRAKRDVEHRALFRRVDSLAAEHRLDVFAQSTRVSQIDEEPDRLVGDAVLRVIEVEAGRLRRRSARPREGSLANSDRRCTSRTCSAWLRQSLPGRERRAGVDRGIEASVVTRVLPWIDRCA